MNNNKTTWLEAIKLYTQKDILLVGLLGFSSGWPLLLTLSVMSYWLATLGVSKSSIGLFALVGVPYNLKFVWAPLIDKLRIPYLTARFGRRRSWAWLSQGALMVSIMLLGLTNPAENLFLTACLALAIAFFSATQDIVVDAFRIELLEARQQGGGAAIFIGGYRMAMLGVGGGALVLSDYILWEYVFIALSLGLLIGAIAVAIAKEPDIESTQPKSLKEFLSSAVVAPFVDFFTRPYALFILLFIVLYKYGDAFGGVMANPFYYEIGFSGAEIGVITKVWGLAATLLGVFLGGVIIARYNIMMGLIIGGILQAGTNIMFVIMAYVGKDNVLLALAISGDNLTGGIGTAALVAFLSHLCSRSHTATQFALLSSAAATGRTFLSSGAGYVADATSWANFFWLTMLLAVPALLMACFLYRKYKI